jgi:hypothetical protein
VSLLRDFETGAALPSMHISVETDVVDYDDPGSLYDTDDEYGPGSFQGHQDFYSVAKCREFAIRIEETSTNTRIQNAVLEGAEPTIGAWGLSRVLFWIIDLGLR